MHVPSYPKKKSRGRKVGYSEELAMRVSTVVEF